MPVKHWSFAGLLLTYECGARCASCYVCSAPGAGGDMSVETGLSLWSGLASASPRGCRVHVGGGEPFRRWETLIELARRARDEGLGPLEAVETNAFWATGPRVVRERVAALDDAGMGRLTISADPYHQQFVPLRRVRRAAATAAEVLGERRVRVRWRDWAAGGLDTAALPADRRRALFADYARKGRDRLNGRAAAELAELLPAAPPGAFADAVCRDRLLRSRHVHADAEGVLCGGTCAGIVLGRAGAADDVGRIWRSLSEDFADSSRARVAPTGREVLRLLVGGGPTALLAAAVDRGYLARAAGYADPCHLCWHVRRWLFERGHFAGQLGPAVVYRP